jgi:anti-anti-sigma factor
MGERNPGDVRLTATQGGGVVRLRVEGELDIATADAMGAALDALRKHRRPAVLDLRNVTFMDGQAAKLLLSTAVASYDEHWRLTVEAMSEPVRRVLLLAGLHAEQLTDSGVT